MSSVPEPQNGLVVRNELLYFLEAWCGIPDEDGSLAHVISCSFSLAAIEDAHRCLETLCNLKIPRKPKPKDSLDWLIRREAAETLVRLRGTAGYIVGSHSFSVDPKLQVSLFRQLWERKKITGHIREHEKKLRALDERLDRRESQDRPIPIPPPATLSSPQNRSQWTVGNSPPLSQDVLDLLVKTVPSDSVSSVSFPLLSFPPMPVLQSVFQPTFTISGPDQGSLSQPRKGRPVKNRPVPVQHPLVQTTFTIAGPDHGSVSPPKKGRPLKVRPPKMPGTLREIRPRGETHILGASGNTPITVTPQSLATGGVPAPEFASNCLPPGAFGSGYGVPVAGSSLHASGLLTAPNPGPSGEQFLVIARDVSVPSVLPSKTAATVRRDLPVPSSSKPLETVVTALRQLAALKASNSGPATRSRGKWNSGGLADRLSVAVKTEKDEGVPAAVPVHTPDESLLLEFSRIDEDDPVSGRLAIDEDSHSQENPGVASIPKNHRDQSPEW